MLGRAFVTTRLSSTTMKSAVDTIANVHPVLVRDFMRASPPLAVSVRLLTLITKKRGSGLVGRHEALDPLGIGRKQIAGGGHGEQHPGGEEGAQPLSPHPGLALDERVKVLPTALDRRAHPRLVAGRVRLELDHQAGAVGKKVAVRGAPRMQPPPPRPPPPAGPSGPPRHLSE